MLSEGARIATLDDVERLVELAEGCRAELAPLRGGTLWALHDAPGEPHRDRFAAQIAARDGRANVWCGTLDESVVGLAAATVEQLRDGRRLAIVEELYVEPGAREMGVGESLVNAVVAWAEAAGCVGVDASVLPGSRAAKNFFEGMGLTARSITVHRPLIRPVPDPSETGPAQGQ